MSTLPLHDAGLLKSFSAFIYYKSMFLFHSMIYIYENVCIVATISKFGCISRLNCRHGKEKGGSNQVAKQIIHYVSKISSTLQTCIYVYEYAFKTKGLSFMRISISIHNPIHETVGDFIQLKENAVTKHLIMCDVCSS